MRDVSLMVDAKATSSDKCIAPPVNIFFIFYSMSAYGLVLYDLSSLRSAEREENNRCGPLFTVLDKALAVSFLLKLILPRMFRAWRGT